MRYFLVGLTALGLWAATEVPASAAWNNVFQPTLFGRLRRPVVSNYYAAPAVSYSVPVAASVPVTPTCNTCTPTNQCSTQYIQRTYYQPVTKYETRSYYEAVTVNRTSYYYEPVTSYRYSCYYDPCSCSYQQVASPVTSYQLRAQNCPSTQWVQRCCQVPVTVQQAVSYWVPQTTCCSTSEGSPIFTSQQPNCAPSTFPSVSTPPATSAPPLSNPPSGSSTAPSISESRTFSGSSNSINPMYNRFYQSPSAPAPAPTPPPMDPPASWKPTQSPPSTPQPAVRLEGIAFGPEARVEGQVVRSDKAPRPNAKVLFVHAQTGQRHTITANSAGRFQTELPAGGWLIYVHGSDDLPSYDRRIDTVGRQPLPLLLTSR